MAAMTGFLDSKIRKVRRPPPSRWGPSAFSPRASALKVFPPADKSAPAQKARPAPVKIMQRMRSSASALSKAFIISDIIEVLKAFSLSGRFKVMVRMFSLTS